ERVRMWQSPWDNAARGGSQIAQALWAMASGGPFGTGAGLGDARYIPAGYTDLILASLAEEFGFAGVLFVAAVCALMIGRAVSTPRRAPSNYGLLLGR